MNMNRRDAMKMGALGVAAAAATTVTGCSKEGAAPAEAPASAASGKKVLGKHKVVIIGGGFGGLTVANNLMKKNKNLDVLVIEKNDTFMSCPVSNTYLGKLEGMELGTFVFDYAEPVQKYGYKMLKSEVVGINRDAKQIDTAHGIVEYDMLVLSPGIAYDYKGQFPTWSNEKIAEVSRTAPGALIPGSEHIALERQLKNMDDGDVIITVPAGKFRCPPAPFERACMIAAYMKKEDIAGKVIILNPSNAIAKGAAFKEAWSELYGDKIEHIDFAKITDVDPKSKTVSYTQQIPTGKKDEDDFEIMRSENKTQAYEVLNLIPTNKANPVVQMAGIKTTKDAFHKVLMNGCTFQTLSDADVYAVGDVVGHAIPPSGQTAVWAGKQCAAEITARLAGKTYELPVQTKTVNAGNVCYSMVGDNPEEGIMVTHDFSWTGKTIKGKGHVPKDAKTGKFRSKGTAKALRDWYLGITADLFS
ncbi:MAG: FAD/NAD(P)-binding oxidoreductase [Campylobacterota bacterium]|nr:FAD/NAD(P)-binding oxidoreductase [Campylobacterota bacterium]